MLGLAVGETGEAAEAAPVGGAGVGVVAAGEGLSSKGAEEFRERARVFQPGLKIAVVRAGWSRSSRMVKRCSPDGRK
jgi:hypothetical protein